MESARLPPIFLYQGGVDAAVASALQGNDKIVQPVVAYDGRGIPVQFGDHNMARCAEGNRFPPIIEEFQVHHVMVDVVVSLPAFKGNGTRLGGTVHIEHPGIEGLLDVAFGVLVEYRTGGGNHLRFDVGAVSLSLESVSYTHLTLPTKA